MLGLMFAGWVIFFLAMGKKYCYIGSQKYRYLINFARIWLLVQLIQIVYIGYGFYEILKPIYNRLKS